MADTPAQESAVSKPTYKTDETAQAFATLLNNETARNEEPTTPLSESKESDLKEDNTELSADDIDVNDIVDNEEATSNSDETLYEVTVNGQKQEVTLDELMKGYSRESDYTKKTMELGDKRRDVETLQENLTKELEAVKNSRSHYAQQLDEFSKQLGTKEENVNWDQLYQDDPAEYVRKKAESDRAKELLQKAQAEQQRIQNEQRQEQEKVYNDYIAKERQLLEDKLPIYKNKDKREQFVKNLTNYAKENGYTDQELSMMVDHRAVLMLADAYKYDQLKKTKLSGKKVNNPPKIVRPNASNVNASSEEKQRYDGRMKKLKKTGSIRDAQSVLKDLIFNK
nr:Non-structural protein NSP1 like [uncultured Mediterranean phage uvMED]